MGRQVLGKTEASGVETKTLTTWKMKTEAQRGVNVHMHVHTLSRSPSGRRVEHLGSLI